jgi:hypothetical protein
MLKLKLLIELVKGSDELILRYWDSDDGCLEASCAVAIRAFMRNCRVVNTREGIRLFFAMHPDRVVALAALRGFAISPTGHRLAA